MKFPNKLEKTELQMLKISRFGQVSAIFCILLKTGLLNLNQLTGNYNITS